MTKRFYLLLTLILLTLLAACAGGDAAPDAQSADSEAALPATATARAANAALTPAPAPTESPLGGSQSVPAGRDDNGTYFLGLPDAPVVVIDHSDFL